MQSSHSDSLPNLNESHSSLDRDNAYMKLLNDHPFRFSEIKVKPIQEYILVHYVKATQPLLSVSKEKAYFKDLPCNFYYNNSLFFVRYDN